MFEDTGEIFWTINSTEHFYVHKCENVDEIKHIQKSQQNWLQCAKATNKPITTEEITSVPESVLSHPPAAAHTSSPEIYRQVLLNILGKGNNHL